MPTSCEPPESFTVTSNASSVVAVTVLSWPGVSVWSPGWAFTDVDVRAVHARRCRRSRRLGGAAARAPSTSRSISSVFETMFDSGTVDAVDAVGRELAERERPEEVVPDDVAREQPVGLAASSAASPGVSFELAVFLNASASPASPLTRSASASIRWTFSAAAVPAGRGPAPVARSAAPARRSRAASSRSASAERPGVVQHGGERLAVRRRLRRDLLHVVHVARVGVVLRLARARLDQRGRRPAPGRRRSRRGRAGAATARCRSAGRATSSHRRRPTCHAAEGARAIWPSRSSRARPRRSRTGCRRRVGPYVAESTESRSPGKGLLLGAK